MKFLRNLLHVSVLCAFASSVAYGAELLKPQAAESQLRFSLDFNGVEIAEALKSISLKSGFTVVPSKKVSGRVTVYLHEVTFDEACRAIASAGGCAYAIDGTVVTFMSQEEFRDHYGVAFASALRQREYVCQFVDAKELGKLLEEVKSSVGKVMVFAQTGTVIMVDTPEVLERMDALVKAVDRKQVSTVYAVQYGEAGLMKEKLDAMFDGSAARTVADARSGSVVVSGSQGQKDAASDMIKAFDAAAPQVEIQSTVVQVTVSDALSQGVDWQKVFRGVDDLSLESSFSPGLTANRGQMSIGSLSQNDYTAVIQMLKTQGDVRTQSNPRLIVVDKQEGKLHVGVREPIVTARNDTQVTSNAIVTTDSVDYVDVGVNFDVVPTVHGDGFITMKIKPEINSVSSTLTTTAGSIIPKVETSVVETTVRIKAGRTLMISGLTKNSDSDETRGLPGLSKIPFLGALFSHREKSKVVTEFVVFLTPRIVGGDEDMKKPATEGVHAHT